MRVSLLFIFLLTQPFGYAEPDQPFSASGEAAKKLDNMVVNGSIPGYQLTVVGEGGVIISQSNQYKGGIVQVEPMQADSKIALFSLSKLFTNLLAMKLIDLGVLSLEEPIEKYLPEFESLQVLAYDGTVKPATRPITVQDLLLHTSGLSLNTDLLGWGNVAEMYAKERLFGFGCLDDGQIKDLSAMTTRVARLPLASEPGIKYSYSIASDVLGRVLEVAAKDNFASLLETYVKTPLGLYDLTMQLDTEDQLYLYQPFIKTYPVPGNYQRYERSAFPSVKTAVTSRQPICASPGSGLIASMRDMTMFASFFLNGMFKQDGEPYFSEEMAAQVFLDGIDIELGPKPLRRSFSYAGSDGFSLASLAIKYENEDARLKGGDHDYYYWAGFSGSALWIDPANSTAGVLLTQLYPSDQFLVPKLVEQFRANLQK